MANIIIIEPDPKIAKEQLEFFEELDGLHNVEHIESVEKFMTDYFQPTTETDSSKIVSSIDILIIRVDLIEDEKPTDWAININNKCKEFEYVQGKTKVKFVFTKYEDDGVDLNSFIHPLVCDVIYLPFDRLLYLQKMELIAEMPDKANPTFLFSQRVDEDIEISKRSFVEALSTVGFSLKNPLDIAINTLTKVYLRTSPKKTIGMYARVISSSSLGENKGFLIDFIYYGLKRTDYYEINNLLRVNKIEQELLEINNDKFVRDEYSSGLSFEDKATKHILVVDDAHRSRPLCKTIKETLSFVETEYVDNMNDFTDKYLVDKVKRSSRLSTIEDIPSGALIFDVNYTSQKLSQVKTMLKSNIHFLNHKPTSFFKDSTSWMEIFNTEDSKAALKEILENVSPNKTVKKLTVLENADYEPRDVVIESIQISDDDVRISIKPMMQQSPEKPKKEKDSTDILKKVDLLIVNLRFLPEDEQDWLDNVILKMKKNGLCRNEKQFKIIIIDPDIADSKLKNFEPKLIKHKNLYNVIHGQAPQTLLMTYVAQAIDCLYTKYRMDNMTWLRNKTACYIAKPVKLNSVSEFGASITSKFPVQPGVVLFMHQYIFEQAPEGVLPARFYFYEENDKYAEEKNKKTEYTSYFTYFGITDSFLKYVRKWIKDNYASSKEKQG